MDERLRLSMFFRTLMIQSVWNFERLQNVGFALAIDPWLRASWKEPRDLRLARERHLAYFNTQPYMAGVALGVACRLEELLLKLPAGRRAEGVVRAGRFKDLLGSTLAALGDGLFWSALRPFSAVLAATTFVILKQTDVEPAWALAAAAFLLPFNAAALGVRWWGLGAGYEEGERVPSALQALPFKRVTRWVRSAGTALALALLVAAFFFPGGLAPVPAVGLAAVCAGFMRLGTGAKALLGGLFAAAAAAALFGVRLGGW